MSTQTGNLLIDDVVCNIVMSRARLLASSRHSSYGETCDEKGDETEHQQCLTWMAVFRVREDEWQQNCGGYTVEIVDRGGRSVPVGKQEYTKRALSDDQDLPDRQGSREASADSSPRREGKEAPKSDCNHKHDDRSG